MVQMRDEHQIVCFTWQSHGVPIDIYFNWTMHGKSPSVTTKPNTVQNQSKLIDLAIIIELTRVFLMPWLSNFLRCSTINLYMFLYLVCFRVTTVTVLLPCRLEAVSKIHVPIYPNLISEGSWNFSILGLAQQRNRDSQETWFHHEKKDFWISQKIKFQNHGIKIARVNTIHITKRLNLL